MRLSCCSAEVADIDMQLFLKLQNKIEEDLSFITDKEREDQLRADDTYGTEIEILSAYPMILSPRFSDVYKERKLIRRKERRADIRLRIDYEKYQNGDDEMKRLLLIKNIVDSIMVVESRKKGDFNGNKLITDILIKLKVEIEQINNL
ncbi:MAG: hypothetical protein J1G04_03055 [Clostridiales bacterium]|nr:hypothetical protein [Clostridiales bacterium]